MVNFAQGRARSIHHRFWRIRGWENRVRQVYDAIFRHCRRFHDRDPSGKESSCLFADHGSHRQREDDEKRQFVEIRQVHRDSI